VKKHYALAVPVHLLCSSKKSSIVWSSRRQRVGQCPPH